MTIMHDLNQVALNYLRFNINFYAPQRMQRYSDETIIVNS